MVGWVTVFMLTFVYMIMNTFLYSAFFEVTQSADDLLDKQDMYSSITIISTQKTCLQDFASEFPHLKSILWDGKGYTRNHLQSNKVTLKTLWVFISIRS